MSIVHTGTAVNFNCYLGTAGYYEMDSLSSYFTASTYYDALTSRLLNSNDYWSTLSKYVVYNNNPYFILGYGIGPTLMLTLSGIPSISLCGGFSFGMSFDAKTTRGMSPTIVQKICYQGEHDICDIDSCNQCSPNPKLRKKINCCVWEPFFDNSGGVINIGATDEQSLVEYPDDCCSSTGWQTGKGTVYVFHNPGKKTPPRKGTPTIWLSCGDVSSEFNDGTTASANMPDWLKELKQLTSPTSWSYELNWNCCDQNQTFKTQSLQIIIDGVAQSRPKPIIDLC